MVELFSCSQFCIVGEISAVLPFSFLSVYPFAILWIVFQRSVYFVHGISPSVHWLLLETLSVLVVLQPELFTLTDSVV